MLEPISMQKATCGEPNPLLVVHDRSMVKLNGADMFVSGLGCFGTLLAKAIENTAKVKKTINIAIFLILYPLLSNS